MSSLERSQESCCSCNTELLKASVAPGELGLACLHLVGEWGVAGDAIRLYTFGLESWELKRRDL